MVGKVSLHKTIWILNFLDYLVTIAKKWTIGESPSPSFGLIWSALNWMNYELWSRYKIGSDLKY